MLQIKTVVLQVLGKQQLPLVHILGKKSCLNYDKHAHLKKKNSLKIWNNVTVHADCATLIELEKLWAEDVGDHTLFLFDVKKYKTNHSNILMLDDLREKKLMRI